MEKEKTPIYFVPGMAAGKEIFRNIKLPKNAYSIHIIEWLIPYKNETLQSYAKRMAASIKHDNAVLIGVSFGGVMVQEMAAFVALKKLIIISSVKTKYEIPLRLRIVKKLKAYKLVPASLIVTSNDLTRFAIGPKSKKRLKLYDEYLHVRDKRYLTWAIEKMVCWDRKVPIDNIAHIHGDEDAVFPIKYINNARVIKGGTHIMLLNKALKVSEQIIDSIEL